MAFKLLMKTAGIVYNNNNNNWTKSLSILFLEPVDAIAGPFFKLLYNDERTK